MQRPGYRDGNRERAVKIYTVCDESRYLIVKNVPALGCVEELIKLFGLYGDIEEYRLLDEEDCEPYTDVFWIKYARISNSRFAKRKLDEYQFLGNLLQVSYAPNYETLADTQDKLEERRRTVLNRIQANQRGAGGPPLLEQRSLHLSDNCLIPSPGAQQQLTDNRLIPFPGAQQQYPPFPLELLHRNPGSNVPNVVNNAQVAYPGQWGTEGHMNHQYFPSPSMNATVQSVREKLGQISEINALPLSSPQELYQERRGEIVAGNEAKGKRPIQDNNLPGMKKQQCQDNRRRI